MEGGISELDQDPEWSIRELVSRHSSEDVYLGFCDIRSDDWKLCLDNPNMIQAKRNHVSEVRVRLFKLIDDEFEGPIESGSIIDFNKPAPGCKKRGDLLPLDRLIPTLLHEFAHAITPTQRVRGHRTKDKDVPKDLRKSKGWHDEHHGELFYKNFAHIMRVAEQLSIFKLPDVPGKFSPSLLRRFDDIDPCSDITLGTVNLQMLAFQKPEGDKETAEVRLMISCSDGKKKPLVISRDASIDDLQKEIQRKFRKRARKLMDRHGQPLESLSTLSNDEVINIVL